MKSEVISAEIFIPVSLYLPIGRYSGTWSGHEVITIIDGKQYRLKTKTGVRGINVKCKVIVEKDSVTIEV